MDDDRYRRAIRRVFEPYRMSTAATLPEEAPAATARGRMAGFGRLPRLALPVAAVVVAAVVAMTALAPAPTAFASWQSTPASADPAVVAVAEDACLRSDPDHLSNLELVGAEQRGAYTMLLFTDGQGGAYGLCLTGDDIDPMVLAGAGPSRGVVDVPATGDGPVAPGGTTTDDHGTPPTADLPPVHFVALPLAGEAVTQVVQAFVIGIAPEVARLEVERPGTESAVATLVDAGIAFVWWPSGSTAGDIVAYDASGNVLDRLPADMSLF